MATSKAASRAAKVRLGESCTVGLIANSFAGGYQQQPNGGGYGQQQQGGY